MLTPEYLLHVSEGAEHIAAQLHTDILKRMVRRILARQKRQDDYLLTATDKWNIQTLYDLGFLEQDVTDAIAKATGLQEKEIKQAMEEAGVKAMEYDDRIYKAAGISTQPLKESPYLIRLMQRDYEATLNTWNNATRTTADASQQTFIKTMDEIYHQVATGDIGYIQAYSEGIDKLASHGLWVYYPTGHRDTIEVAALRCVRTGVSQMSAEIQLARMDEFDVDLVLVSSHMGARPSHQEWQGKVYSRSGTSKKYPDFVSSTGYGTGEGLCGWNCRHNFSPYFEGQENQFDHYDDKENKEEYDKSQEQRLLERTIRKTKRRVEVLKDAANQAQDPALVDMLRQKLDAANKVLRGQQKAYKDYCDENDLRPLAERLRIAHRKAN